MKHLQITLIALSLFAAACGQTSDGGEDETPSTIALDTHQAPTGGDAPASAPKNNRVNLPDSLPPDPYAHDEPIPEPPPAPAPETYAGKFDERWRPRFHFTPPSGWMNDPNGLVYACGRYHLYYQYFPDGNRWGPMHWGHASSTDLISWEHHPIALYPDDKGLIFSGSAVVDERNVSGLGTADNPALIAFFTYHDAASKEAGAATYETQGMAYSLDCGMTFTKPANNVVVDNPGLKDFRDPKVSYDAEHEQYVMTLAAGDRVRFYVSDNLLDWDFASEWGEGFGEPEGVWECPELLRLDVDELGEKAYVLLVSKNAGHPAGGSGTFFVIGDWDGKSFTLRREPGGEHRRVKWLDFGRDNYAGVTFGDLPDGRKVLLGWMSNWWYAQEVPTESWRGAMTLPRELSIVPYTTSGLVVGQAPVRELANYYGESIDLPYGRFDEGELYTIDLNQLSDPMCFELSMRIEQLSSSHEISFTLTDADNRRFYRFGMDLRPGVDNIYYTDRDFAGPTNFHDAFAREGLQRFPNRGTDGVVDLRAVFDRTSAEIFFDEGVVATDIFFPDEPWAFLIIEVAPGPESLDATPGFSVENAKLRGIRPAR